MQLIGVDMESNWPSPEPAPPHALMVRQPRTTPYSRQQQLSPPGLFVTSATCLARANLLMTVARA